ncbi:MAG: proline dehydrogenase family protein [Methanomicrobiales archaeon]|nr:proline dehydrogenase family protein [Methanomicrobiales archaeon]
MPRWTEHSVNTALQRCKQRNSEGITCIVHLLDEYTRDQRVAEDLAGQYSTLIGTLSSERIEGGISIKLTSLGSLVDRELAEKLALDLAREAHLHRVGFEIDMEGKGHVEYTLETARSVRKQGSPVVLALQAYLDRSRDDLLRIQEAGIIPRLVKGAYQGDVSEFETIENRFRDLAEVLLETQNPFHVGTHDPFLLSWLRQRLGENHRNLVRFGFLMGLSDVTKQSMASDRWEVSEYIPIGEEGSAYIARRERYLNELRNLGRDPAP